MYWFNEILYDKELDLSGTDDFTPYRPSTDDYRPDPMGGGKVRTAGGERWFEPGERDYSKYVAPPRYNCTACPPGRASNRSGVYYDACLVCPNGTYANDPEGQERCQSCEPGRYQTERDSDHCDECEPGKYTNWTGEGHTCSLCSRGKHANGTGFHTCIRCSYKNDWVDDIPHGEPVVGGKFFFQKKEGQQYCRHCKNSRKQGGYGCNEKSGEITCYGLYTPKSKCKRPQDVFSSMVISYSFFLFAVFVLIPMVFTTGSLAVLSRQLRKDVQVMVQWMQESTGKAVVAQYHQELLGEGDVREELIREYFRVLTRREYQYSRIQYVALSDIGPMISEMGVDEEFLDMLNARTCLGMRKDEVLMDFDTFRNFLSILAQRLGYARSQARAFEMYRARMDEKNGAPIVEEDIKEMALALGFELTPHEEDRLAQLSTKGGAFMGMIRSKVAENQLSKAGGAMMNLIKKGKAEEKTNAPQSKAEEKKERRLSTAGSALMGFLKRKPEEKNDQAEPKSDRRLSTAGSALMGFLKRKTEEENDQQPSKPGGALMSIAEEEPEPESPPPQKMSLASKFSGKSLWKNAAKLTLMKEEEPNSPHSPGSPGSPTSPISPNSGGPRHVYNIDLFGRATNKLGQQRFVDELLLVMKKRHTTLRSAFDSRSKVELGNELSEPYLNERAFRSTCGSLSLTWDMQLLDDVIHGASNGAKKGLAARLLQKLESEAWCSLVTFLALQELLLKAMKFRWMSILLILDFLARVILHVVQGIGPLTFFRNHHRRNLRDMIIVGAELSYWYIIMGGNEMAQHIVTLLPLHLEHMVRCFRLLRFSWVILHLFRLAFKYVRLIIDIVLNILRLIFDKVLCRLCRRKKKKKEKNERKRHKQGCCKKKPKIKKDNLKVTFDILRRYKSAYDAKHNAHFWPLSAYRDAFSEFDPRGSGTMDVEDLGPFLSRLGFDSGSVSLPTLKQLTSLNDGKRLIFFDDLLPAMAFIRLEDYETQGFEGLYSRRLHAKESLKQLIVRFVKTIATICGEFIIELLKLCSNLFILASSFFGNDEMTLKIEQFASALYGVVANSPLADILGPLFGFFGPLMNLINSVASVLSFDFEVEGGVTCTGVRSLILLPILYGVTAIILIIFDSSSFVFLKVSDDLLKDARRVC